jgi:GxxExxY protein
LCVIGSPLWLFFLTTKYHKGFHRVPQRIFNNDCKYYLKIMNIEEIFKKVLDSSFQVHTGLGPGLLESAYLECLYYELIQSGLKVEKQKPLPLVYKEVKLEAGFRIDLLVENCVVIEIKSVEALCDIHMAQILTYLKLSGCKLGLLVNFNVKHLKDGIKQVIR